MKYVAFVLVALSLSSCARHDGAAPEADLQALHGQWVVINYWAQWCKPCIEEIPQLNALDSQYDQVTVLGVNYDGAEGADLAQQRKTLGVTFASVADPAAQLGTPRPTVLPTTLIVDPQGRLTETLLGPQTLESLERATGQVPNSAGQ
jgi:thiol-disulfide isomerase/thioredoxin